MKLPWHRAKPHLLAEVRADVEAFSSTLHVFVEDDVVRICGTFPVRHGGDDLEAYHIEIAFSADYPDELPIVREKGGRNPWTAKRHVYSNGNACVLLPEDRWWSFPPGRRFGEYLRGPLHNYFLGQSVVDQGGEWPFGEHDHGWHGVAEFYQEKFGTKNAAVVVRGLKLIADGKVRGHWPCPCGSGRIIRSCHPGIIEVAKKMPAAAARKSFDSLTSSVRADRKASPASQSPPRT